MTLRVPSVNVIVVPVRAVPVASRRTADRVTVLFGRPVITPCETDAALWTIEIEPLAEAGA